MLDCYQCSRPIPEGERFVSVSWFEEYAQGWELIPVQAAQVLRLCRGCAEHRDFTFVVVPFKGEDELWSRLPLPQGNPSLN